MDSPSPAPLSNAAMQGPAVRPTLKPASFWFKLESGVRPTGEPVRVHEVWTARANAGQDDANLLFRRTREVPADRGPQGWFDRFMDDRRAHKELLHDFTDTVIVALEACASRFAAVLIERCPEVLAGGVALHLEFALRLEDAPRPSLVLFDKPTIRISTIAKDSARMLRLWRIGARQTLYHVAPVVGHSNMHEYMSLQGLIDRYLEPDIADLFGALSEAVATLDRALTDQGEAAPDPSLGDASS